MYSSRLCPDTIDINYDINYKSEQLEKARGCLLENSFLNIRHLIRQLDSYMYIYAYFVSIICFLNNHLFR